MNTKTKAFAILTVLINSHSSVTEHGSLNSLAIIKRMERLVAVLREVCFNLAKMEESTASAIMETADNLLEESIASYLNDVKLDEEELESQRWLNTIDDESFDCDDQDCNPYQQESSSFNEPMFRTMDTDDSEDVYVKHPILWTFNGIVLNTTDLDDLPF